jgi:hypothetical protein
MVSLLDSIKDAKGAPAANYLKGGRTVLRITKITHKDPTALDPKAQFRIDGEILGSTNPAHKGQVGQSGTMNLNFKFAEQDLARERRALAAAATSKGVGKGENGFCSEAEAAERALEFVGTAQPLVGAVVTIEATEGPQRGDPNKTFTKYEVVVPNERDLSLCE